MNSGQLCNPFSSHLVEPAQGGYIFAPGSRLGNLDSVMETLQRHAYRGHLLGPHGAGKSTLLYDIRNRLLSEGHAVARWQCSDRHRGLPSGWWSDISSNAVVLIDGAERLYPGLLGLVRLITRRRSKGLIITTHSPIRLGARIPVEPSARALAAKVTSLVYTNGATPQPPLNLAHSIARQLEQHQGNAREVLFDLYMQYEQQKPAADVTGATSSTA